MIQIKISQIKGKKLIESRLKAVRNQIYNGMNDMLEYSLELLRDRAIDNVNALSKSSPSIGGESIRDTSNWEITHEGPLSSVLTCKSEHAAIVEFGTEKARKVKWDSLKDKGLRGWPILSQGGSTGIAQYRRTFTIQSPMSYFRSAINSEWVKQSMLNRIKREVGKIIRGV